MGSASSKKIQQKPRVLVSRSYTGTIDPDVLIQDLLSDRKVENTSEFMNPPHPKNIPFSSLIKNFDKRWGKTKELLKKLHETGGSIVVYTDYDADGVTGGTIMWEGLHKLGFKVMPYIPDRKTEGYGFSIKGLDHVIEEFKPDLIISVDHGIVGHEQIDYAHKKGVPIIVTDHHQKQDGEPKKAFEVFHTDKLSGSGVAYFFIKQLYEDFGKPLPDDYMALAAIGTVADMIPLVGPSRSVVAHGLKALSQTPRIGLRHLMKEAGITDGQVMETYHIGFMLAPRINAFGRLDHAMDALRLLCTTSYDKAIQLSSKATTINKQRQTIVDSAVKEALKMTNPDEKIIILTSHDWDEGIIGLIAGKVLQAYNKPTIVITQSNGHSKASVRSIHGVDIMEFLSDLKDFFIDMGGHKAAAGFTISTEKIDGFKEAAYKKAQTAITDEMLVYSIIVDAAVNLESMTFPLAKELSHMEPFGMGNQKPLFMFEGLIKDMTALGKLRNHTKLFLTNGDASIEGIMFNMPMDSLPEVGSKTQIIAELALQEWRGRESHQALVKHVLPV